MITFIKGNILESPCEALVNTVNCKAVMGRGLALQFKDKYPHMFADYRGACRKNEVKVGSMHVWRNPEVYKWLRAREGVAVFASPPGPLYVINFPTKDHWKNPSQIEWITSGLADLVHVVNEKEIKSIAIPPLGCGLGGLNWYQVKKEIEKFSSQLEKVKIEVYEP